VFGLQRVVCGSLIKVVGSNFQGGGTRRMSVEIVHVYGGDANSSSRIKMQLAWAGGRVLDPINVGWIGVLWGLWGSRANVVVFHGQSTLPLLLASAIYSFLSRRKWSIVYDMHDLHEKPLVFRLKAVLRYWILYLFEYFASRLDIDVITVSKGLARVFFLRYRRSPQVVYNVAFEVGQEVDVSTPADRARGRVGVVYFGLIKPDRVPLSLARDVLQADKFGVFDLYGKVPKGDFAVYSAELDQLASHTSLRLCGPYKPEAMGFLEKYRYSWLCFESDRLNIRYCMPNKLFQSLSAGLCCVISDRLVEARTLFGDACVSYRDFLRICAGELESPADKIDWKDVEARMQKVAERSRAVFLEVCSA